MVLPLLNLLTVFGFRYNSTLPDSILAGSILCPSSRFSWSAAFPGIPLQRRYPEACSWVIPTCRTIRASRRIPAHLGGTKPYGFLYSAAQTSQTAGYLNPELNFKTGSGASKQSTFYGTVNISHRIFYAGDKKTEERTAMNQSLIRLRAAQATPPPTINRPRASQADRIPSPP
jgi:hypothetical protein